MTRVLVVDDEPLMRLAVHQALADSGCLVSEAADARTARETLAVTSFDVVVLDYRMPDSHDLSLLAAVRQLAPDAQVIMMTAHPSGPLVAAAEALGATAVLHKPVDLEDLCRLVGSPAAITRTPPTRAAAPDGASATPRPGAVSYHGSRGLEWP